MKEKHEKTILAYLVRIEERLERIEEQLGDIKTRQTLTEEGVANLSRAYAGLQTRIDRLDDRLARVESRVERLGGPERGGHE